MTEVGREPKIWDLLLLKHRANVSHLIALFKTNYILKMAGVAS